jgi:hypothetical protein
MLGNQIVHRVVQPKRRILYRRGDGVTVLLVSDLSEWDDPDSAHLRWA